MDNNTAQILQTLYTKLSELPRSEESYDMIAKLQDSILDCIKDYSDEKFKTILAHMAVVSTSLKESAKNKQIMMIASAQLINDAEGELDKLTDGVDNFVKKVEHQEKTEQVLSDDASEIEKIIAQLQALSNDK